MLSQPGFSEALTAAMVAALLAVWLMRSRPEQRGLVINMLLVDALGLIALLSLDFVHLSQLHPKLGPIAREAALSLVAWAVIRIGVTFLFRISLSFLKLPRILDDMVIVGALLAYAVMRVYLSHEDLSSLLTTSAIITGAIALSLQDTFQNLWAGISLQMDDALRMGDWIRIDNIMGRIVGVRWRYVAIATNNGETILVPNNVLLKNHMNLLARRGEQRIGWRRAIFFNMGYDYPPGQVIEVVEQAFAHAGIAHVADQPTAFVVCTDFAASSIQYALRYWLTDLSQDEQTDSAVRAHIFTALLRRGMEMPYPISEIIHTSQARHKNVRHLDEHSRKLDAIETIDLFQTLTTDEKIELADQLYSAPFAPGDLITKQGNIAQSLFILVRGRVHVEEDQHDSLAGSNSHRHRIASLDAPNIFGERAMLTGAPRRASIIAGSDVLTYRLDRSDFETLLKKRPHILEGLSQTLAARQAHTEASQKARDQAMPNDSVAQDLLKRMRQFFGL